MARARRRGACWRRTRGDLESRAMSTAAKGTGPNTAPGHPGTEPRWTSSRKHGVGTAIGARSRVWFTISHGVLNEVYYPRVDQANIRDMGLLVTDGSTFFSEEKRHTTSEVTPLGSGVPGYRVTNTC